MTDPAAEMPEDALAEVIPLAPLPGTAVEDKPKRGGRPRGSLNKATRDVRIAAQKYTKRALTVITKLAEQSNDPRVQLQAAVELLDRAHGKPAQTTLVGGDADNPLLVGRVDPDELRNDGRELARRVALILHRADDDAPAVASITNGEPQMPVEEQTGVEPSRCRRRRRGRSAST